MSLFDPLDLEKLSPARLWSALDAETRQSAARCLYGLRDDPAARAEADAAIAVALHYRPTAVRQLPQEKRVHYLTRVVRPDDALAGSLLRALHLAERKEMLETFLDQLGIRQRDGVIDDEVPTEPPAGKALRPAVALLRERYPAPQVDLYLTTLLAMDREFWNGLADCLRC
jgi:hypothetical protein